MKSEAHLYLIMYDITHDRALQKVAKLMEVHGYERMNYSVWHGIKNPAKNEELKQALIKLLHTEEAEGSRMYFLPVKIRDLEKMRTFDGKKVKEMDYWLGRQHTTFF